MNYNLEKIINESNFTPKEKGEILKFFSKLLDDDLNIILEMALKDPKWLKIFYDNYQNKKQALSQKNQPALEKILKEEEKYLNNF